MNRVKTQTTEQKGSEETSQKHQSLEEKRKARRLKASRLRKEFDLASTNPLVKKYCTSAQSRKELSDTLKSNYKTLGL